MTYVVIEMVDVEVVGLRLWMRRDLAMKDFEGCCADNEVMPEDDLSRELQGTVAIAGGVEYSVQVLERVIH